MNTIAISDARSKLADVVQSISNNLSRTYITVNGKPKAALISLEELESLEETAEILTIPDAKASIRKGVKQARNQKGSPLASLI